MCRSTVPRDRSSTSSGGVAPWAHPGLVSTYSPTVAIVPTYNEAATLHLFVADFERDAPGIDLLVVDDASPDGTGALADRMAATRPWLHVLHRPGKDGLGNAYRAGFAWALERDYAAVAQLDADLSHPPALLPRMLEALERGADLVLGSRYAPAAAATAGRSTGASPAASAAPPRRGRSACPTATSRAASSSGARRR